MQAVYTCGIFTKRHFFPLNMHAMRHGYYDKLSPSSLNKMLDNKNATTP
jgi:hypothetical protein